MMTKTTAEGNGGGALLRRTILGLAVAALMAALLMDLASPAFAKVDHLKLRTPESHFNGVITPSEKINISGHTKPSGQPQGGGGADKRSEELGGVDGTVVETPSEILNGNFHGDCSEPDVNCP